MVKQEPGDPGRIENHQQFESLVPARSSEDREGFEQLSADDMSGGESINPVQSELVGHRVFDHRPLGVEQLNAYTLKHVSRRICEASGNAVFGLRHKSTLVTASAATRAVNLVRCGTSSKGTFSRSSSIV